MHTLTLNADGQPISIVPISACTWQEGIKLLFIDRVTVLEEYDEWIVHSPSVSLNVPSVIMMRDYIKVRRTIRFSKENIFLRDGYECQYCGGNYWQKTNELTLDHVIPRFHGGKTNWRNVCASCVSCNLEKAHFMKMKPKTVPHRPTYYELAAKHMTFPLTVPHESWVDYLGWERNLITVKLQR